MDRWDCMGSVGAGLVGGGIWTLTSVGWACIWWGVVLLALYVTRELRQAG